MNETNSGTLLLSNLPPKALGGIDILSFTPGPNFRGVKLIPPGFHFIFTGSTDSFSIRHGIWFQINSPPYSSPELFIAKWNDSQEHLVPEENAGESMRLRANLGSLWTNSLLSYRQHAEPANTSAGSDEANFDDGSAWRKLTSHMKTAVLTRILGSPTTKTGPWSLTTGSSAPQDIDDIPGLSSTESRIESEKELHFLPINLKQTWREGATGRERTDAARDRSWALNDLIEQSCTDKDWSEILGELEFCFAMVLTLANYSCLEQWKRILGLLFTCRSAVDAMPDLFVDTIKLLRLQLKHTQAVDGGLFDMTEDGGALLRGLIRKFKTGLADISGRAKVDVMDEIDELEEFLRSEFGIEIGDSFLKRGMFQLEDGEEVEAEVSGYEEDDETGEYAPQVVELTPAQKKALSVDDAHTNGHEHESDQEDEDNQDIEDMDERY